MLMWNPSKLTTAGKALLAKAQAGQTSIQITKAQTGSGSYSSGENIEGRTALKNPKQTFPIQNKVISDAENTVILKIAITNKSEEETLSTGYDITEFGIFAQDPQKGEILYSIATASTSDYASVQRRASVSDQYELLPGSFQRGECNYQQRRSPGSSG